MTRCSILLLAGAALLAPPAARAGEKPAAATKKEPAKKAEAVQAPAAKAEPGKAGAAKAEPAKVEAAKAHAAEAQPAPVAAEEPPPPKAPAPVPPPTPAPQLAQLAFVTGNFNCDGMRPEPPPRLGHPYKARFASKWVLDKFFLGWQHNQVKTKELPLPLVREGHVGWDVGLKRFVLGGADNAGAEFLLRAEPATGDQIVFKGSATAPFGRHVPVVYTFTRKEKGFELAVDATDNDGQLVRTAQETCLRGK